MFLRHEKSLILSILFIFSVASVFLKCFYITGFIFLLILFYFLFNKKISLRFLFISILVFLSGVFYTFYRIPVPDYLYKNSSGELKLTGVINSISLTTSRKSKKIELKTKKICIKNKECVNSSLKTIVFAKSSEKNLKIGNLIEVNGKFDLPQKAKNPSQFDYAQHLKTKGIFSIIYAENVKVLKTHESYIWYIFQKINDLRENILKVHSKYLTTKQLEILGGIVFGEKAVNIENSIKKEFISSGLLHLLAASGMNVGFIFASVFGLFNFMRLKREFSFLAGGVSIFIYSIMTGFPPSIVRAMGMMELAIIGKLMEREINNIVLLLVVAAVTLTYNPLLITDVGFQLSFAATFGLLFMTEDCVSKLKPIPVWLSGIIAVPVIAQLFVLPIQVYHFNNIAIYSIVANIVVVPVTGILSVSGFISCIFALITFLGEKICFISNLINSRLIDFLLFTANKFSHIPDALFYSPSISLSGVFLYYFLLILVGLFLKNKIKFKLFSVLFSIFLILILICGFEKYAKYDIKITFFSLEQGESTLIEYKNKMKILIDTGRGSNNDFNPANTVILPYLRDRGINKIDLLVLSHPDYSHIGGTKDFLEGVNVLKIIDNGEKSNTEKLTDLQKYLDKKKIFHVSEKSPYFIKDGYFNISFYKPKVIKSRSQDEKSLISQMNYKDFNVLLLSDNSKKSLKALESKIKKPVQVIKLGNHGSKISVDEDVIKKLGIKKAIISKDFDKYSFIDKEQIKILRKNKIKTIRTDKDYCIQVFSNGKTYKIDTYKESLRKQKPVL